MESTKSEASAHIYEINAREKLSIKSGGNIYQITKEFEIKDHRYQHTAWKRNDVSSLVTTQFKVKRPTGPFSMLNENCHNMSILMMNSRVAQFKVHAKVPYIDNFLH